MYRLALDDPSGASRGVRLQGASAGSATPRPPTPYLAPGTGGATSTPTRAAFPDTAMPATRAQLRRSRRPRESMAP